MCFLGLAHGCSRSATLGMTRFEFPAKRTAERANGQPSRPGDKPNMEQVQVVAAANVRLLQKGLMSDLQ